jgi:hypothetical protein
MLKILFLSVYACFYRVFFGALLIAPCVDKACDQRARCIVNTCVLEFLYNGDDTFVAKLLFHSLILVLFFCFQVKNLSHLHIKHRP